MEIKLEKCLDNINAKRLKAEAPFVFCLWKAPELYEDYKTINVGSDDTIKTEDGRFYFDLGRAMYNAGFRTFDNITVSTYLEDKPDIKKTFQEHGGYREVSEFKQLVDVENIDAYYDKIAKLNILNDLCIQYFRQFEDISQFNDMSSQNVFDLFEYQLNSVSLATNHDVKMEDLVIDDKFVEECDSGEAIGLSYAKNCPALSATTLGLPLGDLYMVGGHSGTGKSSFIFENIILPLNNDGIKTAIISNEMKSNAYKNMLLVHILTQDMNYWGITRKKLKQGHFTAEQKLKIREAQRISKEKYGNICFVKLFDTDTSKFLKIGKKLSKLGYQCICYDTMKASDSMDTNGSMWQQLMLDSRKIFQLASKENISIVVTYQLALHTTNLRYLDSTCLSNSKQIKEVFSEMLYFRRIWDDERTEKKYDCKPYKLVKTETGKYVKKMIDLDDTKEYLIGFLDKTRNDEGRQQFIYEWNSRFNRWVEIGMCTVINDHRGY